MCKNEFVNDILMMMNGNLDEVQLMKLRACLDVNLYKYDLNKKETNIICVDFDDNYKYLKRFQIDLKIEGLSEKSIKNYVRETTKMLDALNKNFREITKDDISYYLASLLSKGLSSTTVDNTRKFIKAFYNWCVYNDILNKNPFLKIKCIKRNTVQKEIITEHELEQLRDACETKRDLAMIDFLNCTGVRVSECAQIKMDDINFVTGKCSIYATKTQTFRDVFLDAKALKHICDYRNELQRNNLFSEYLFTSNRKEKENKSLSCSTFEQRLKQITGSANINKHITVHTFRKTFASRCSRKGMQPMIIATLLGHSDYTTTAKYYIKINKNDLQYEYDKCLC